MTNPFDTLVGLKGVTTTPPEPTLWLNDLPGMSTELVSAVADVEDYTTGDTDGVKATWARAKRLGLERLRSMIEGELNKSADFQYIGTRTGNLTGSGSQVLIQPSAAWTGYSVTASIAPGDELVIKSISLDSAETEAVETTINVFDEKGGVLATKSVTVEPGYNELVIDCSLRTRFGRLSAVFVGIDTSALALRTLAVGQVWACDAEDHNNRSTDAAFFSLEPSVSAKGSINNLDSLILQGSTGLMLHAMVRRSLVEVMGRHADRLAWGYAHIVGSVLMSEKLASPNVNLFTNTNRLFTEEYEEKLMKDARSLVMPVARSIVIELRPTKAMQADPDFQPGYFNEGFV